MSHVLVAEDDPLLAEILRFNLSRAGHKVTVARNGLQAMEQLRREVPDLLVTDFQMPGATGGDVCRFVRQEMGNPNLPIVVCSAKGLELNAIDFKSQWSVSEIIYKPFSMNLVTALVARLTSVAATP